MTELDLYKFIYGEDSDVVEDKWERATYGIGLVEENEKTPKYFSEGG